MSKYIDVDRLRKEIDHRIDILEDMSIKCAKNDDTEMHAYYHGKAVSLQELLSFIDSFQQEQPSIPDLEEAVEGEIQMRYSGCLCAKTVRAINEDKFKLGDKVRLIVLKAEEE